MLPECQEVNWERLQKALCEEPLRPRRDTVVLLDGDRTLSPEDTSRIFLDRAKLPLRPIKDIFEVHGYSYTAFRSHAGVYLQVADKDFSRLCEEAAEAAALYPGAPEFLGRAAEIADVYVVTAGVSPIWRRLLERAQIGQVRVIGGIHRDARYVIGREEKGRICAHFRGQGRQIAGFGDSDVDSLMLQGTHRAVVVVNHRNNADLLPHLRAHPALFQISFSTHVHPEIPRICYETAHQVLTGA